MPEAPVLWIPNPMPSASQYPAQCPWTGLILLPDPCAHARALSLSLSESRCGGSNRIRVSSGSPSTSTRRPRQRGPCKRCARNSPPVTGEYLVAAGEIPAPPQSPVYVLALTCLCAHSLALMLIAHLGVCTPASPHWHTPTCHHTCAAQVIPFYIPQVHILAHTPLHTWVPACWTCTVRHLPLGMLIITCSSCCAPRSPSHAGLAHPFTHMSCKHPLHSHPCNVHPGTLSLPYLRVGAGGIPWGAVQGDWDTYTSPDPPPSPAFCHRELELLRQENRELKKYLNVLKASAVHPSIHDVPQPSGCFCCLLPCHCFVSSPLTPLADDNSTFSPCRPPPADVRSAGQQGEGGAEADVGTFRGGGSNSYPQHLVTLAESFSLCAEITHPDQWASPPHHRKVKRVPGTVLEQMCRGWGEGDVGRQGVCKDCGSTVVVTV